jgi:tetratricopeptide (TPR) repeat protein
MPSGKRVPSASLAECLRKRRRQLGLTLREVERRSERSGELIPFSTLAKIEQARIDPGTRRLALLMRLYGLPFQLAGDLIELEDLSAAWPQETDLELLYRRGVESWKRGDIRQGLAHLFSLRTRTEPGEKGRLARQKALLAFAIGVGGLGKYRLSRQIVEDLLLETPVPQLLVPVLVQAATAWRGLGSLEAALAFIERAAAHLAPDDHQQRGWVLHGKAKILTLARRQDEAEAEIARAIRAYRRAGDTHGECAADGVRLRIHRARGEHERMLRVARRARKKAEEHGHESFAHMHGLDEGCAAVALGRSDEGLAMLRTALAGAVATGDQELEFHAHYHLWKLYEALGDPERAQVERDASRYFVRFVDELSEEAEEVRALPDG